MYRIPFAQPITGITKLGVALGNSGPTDTEGNPKAIIDIDTGRVDVEFRDIVYDANDINFSATGSNGELIGGIHPVRHPVTFMLTLEEKRLVANICMQAALRDGVLRPPDAANVDEVLNSGSITAPVVETVTVTVIPSTAEISLTGTLQFEAVVMGVPTGSTVAVDWFMRTGDSGSVDVGGVYTPTVTGSFRILARSVYDTNAVGYGDVTVV